MMRYVVMMSLVAWAAWAAPVHADVLDDLQPGRWIELAGTNIDAVKPSPLPPGNSFCPVKCWNSAAYDTTRNRFIAWGGGHQDYAGNEVYAFNIATLTWSRLNEPSAHWPNTAPSQDVNADGTPASVHTYDGVEYLPNVDRFFSHGGAKWWEGHLINRTWFFDFATLTWTEKAQVPGSWSASSGLVTAYESATGHVWMAGQFSDNRLKEYDPVGNTWTERSTLGINSSGMVGEIDQSQRKFVAIGLGVAHAWDLTTVGSIPRTSPTITGDTGILSATYPGMTYDSQNKKIVMWNGGTDVYVLDTRSWIMQQVAPGAGNTVTPPAADINGTYGRFRYIPSKNVFLLVNSETANVYAYKLDPTQITGLDFATRCAAPGVVRCWDFDSQGTTGPKIREPFCCPGVFRGQVVSDQKASGAGSLEFTIPSLSTADSAGSFELNFSDSPYLTQFGEGQTFYVQWRQRFSSQFLNNDYYGEFGQIDANVWKLAIIGEGDRVGDPASSCTQLEVVVNNIGGPYVARANGGFPTMYHSCGGKDGAFEGLVLTQQSPLDYDRQPGTPCWHTTVTGSSQTRSGYIPACIGYVPDEWMTFQVRITIGTWYLSDLNYNQDSWIQLYVAQEGQPSVLTVNYPNYDIANNDGANAKYGKVWLLTYQTGKDGTISYPEAKVWYDELIISTQKIDDPTIDTFGASEVSAPSRRMTPLIDLRRMASPDLLHLVSE